MLIKLINDLISLSRIEGIAFFQGSSVLSVTNDKLKSCKGIFVTTEWNSYCITQPIFTVDRGNHFIFDKNGTIYTAVIKWTKSTGTCAVINNVTDIKIIAITAII